MPINRSRYIDRVVRNEDGGFVELPDSHELILSTFSRYIGALEEFGGEVYVGAVRRRIAGSEIVEHNDPRGDYVTVGYVVGYNSRSQVPKSPSEPDEEPNDAYGSGPAPEPESLRDEIESEVAEMEKAEA